MKPIDLSKLSDHFPWGRLYEDLGYAMPYPEVTMTSDRAYALQTQIFGLLMMQSWGVGNEAKYKMEKVEATHEAYTLDYELRLETIDEAWEYIGIAKPTLIEYMKQSLVDYVLSVELDKRSFRSVSLAEGRYMLVAEEK